MKYFSYTLAFIAFFSCSPSSDQLNYPKTEKIPVVDTYFDEEVIDNNNAVQGPDHRAKYIHCVVNHFWVVKQIPRR